MLQGGDIITKKLRIVIIGNNRKKYGKFPKYKIEFLVILKRPQLLA